MSIDKQALSTGDGSVKTYYIHPAAFGGTQNPGHNHIPVVKADDFEKLRAKLEAAEKHIAELESENEYIRVRFKESDLLFGKLILTMRAAVIEQEYGEGDKAAMDWIFNQLAGPGEFAPESEEDAQKYFNREVEKIDVEFSKCMDYFTKRREGLRAAVISVKGE